jgi:hypothetical protein
MPPQQQPSTASGIVALVVLLSGFLIFGRADIDRVPVVLRGMVKPVSYWLSYIATRVLLQSPIGVKLFAVGKFCLTRVILIALLPFVLIYQGGWLLRDGWQRARVMAQLGSGLKTSMSKNNLTPNPDFVLAEDAKSTPVLAESSYRYRKLDDTDGIRLLEVFPATGDGRGPLRGRIVHARLSDAPRFTALSYCWNSMGYPGPAENKNPIIDLGSEGTLAVTRNLFDGLYSAFGKGHCETNFLWVDQICINQDDLVEKSSQVTLMKDIYKQAHLVLVWLGNDAPTGEGDRALLFADHIASRIEEKRLLSPDFDFLPIMTSTVDIGIPSLHDATADYISLIALLTRPWFGRSWIVQEISLNANKRVLCGSTEVPFDSLTTALVYCTRSLQFLTHWIPRETKMAFSAMRQSAKFATRSALAPSFNLMDVLARHRGCKATLGADKVFAFLNISDDHKALGIEADYTMAKRSVFIQTAVALIEHHENLDLLGSANAWPRIKTNGLIASELLEFPDVPQSYLDENGLNDDNHADDLPSWVPDWSVPTFAPSFQHRGEFGDYFSDYQASGNSEKSVRFRMDSTQLGLNGHLFDVVVSVGPRFVDDNKYQYPVFRSWANMCGAWSKGKRYTPTGEDMLTAFVNTLTCGGKDVTRKSRKPGIPFSVDPTAQAEGSAEEDWLGGNDAFTDQYCMLMWVLQFIWVGQTLLPGFNEKPYLFNLVLAFHQLLRGISEKLYRLLGMRMKYAPVSSGFRLRLFAAAEQRRFVYTREGFIGLASPQTRPGDCIALFAGGKVPLVIRDAEGPEGNMVLWRVVGDAYVHGIMFGEGFLPEDQRHTFWIA